MNSKGLRTTLACVMFSKHHTVRSKLLLFNFSINANEKEQYYSDRFYKIALFWATMTICLPLNLRYFFM